MPNPFRTIGLVAATAAASFAAHGGAPPRPGPPRTSLTVFPELTARPPNGEWFPRLSAALARPTPADAPPLTRVRVAQVSAGLAYLNQTKHVIEIGRWDPYWFEPLLRTTADAYRTAESLEPTSAGKIALGEERVRVMKLFEQFANARRQTGDTPPLQYETDVFHRLQAEAELLQLMEATKGVKDK